MAGKILIDRSTIPTSVVLARRIVLYRSTLLSSRPGESLQITWQIRITSGNLPCVTALSSRAMHDLMHAKKASEHER